MIDLPQLRMRHSLANVPHRRDLPASCSMREAGRDDALGIAAVLSAAFDDMWDAGRVFRELCDDPDVPLTFVIERSGVILATASYQVKAEPDPMAGWVHWVGVHPDARGFGLGEIVSHRVLAEAVARNRSCVLLTTDDFRLPAIRTYLKLGFEPDCWHKSHVARWIAVREVLGANLSAQ